MMEPFKLHEEVSSQDLELLLTRIPRDQELPVLRNELEGYDSQEIINEQLKYEESLEAENHNAKLSFLNESSPTGHNPSTVNFPGSFLFSAEPDNSCPNKTWLYSDILDKVFIDVNKVLKMKLKVNNYVPGLFVRALPVYSSCDYSQEPVIRCPTHLKRDDPDFKAHIEDGKCLCFQYRHAGHVVRAHSHTAVYQYDQSSRRHSVVIPLPQPQAGEAYVTVPFSFACKTSCPSGMQRRPIVVVFTLENEFCEVIGRQIAAVKICACPKRDMERLERDHATSGEHGDPDNKSRKKHELGSKRCLKCLSTDALSFNLNSLAKKIKLVPAVQSSDTDISDYERENMKKDLEAALAMVKQVEPVMNLIKTLEPALQQVRTLSDKLNRMYRKLNRMK